MFLISKLFTYLALPPGSFIILSLVIAFFILIGLRKTAICALLLTAFLLYLLSVEPVKDFLILPLEDRYPPLKDFNKIDADGIVVLGGGQYERSPEEEMNPSLSPESLKRTVYGFRLYKKLDLPVIVSGGSVLQKKSAASSAVIMKTVMANLGADKKRITIEIKSKNTMQNARFTAVLMKKKGWKSAILVTSAYHMPRSVLSFTKEGVHVIPAPTDFKTDRSEYAWYSFMPKMSCLEVSWKALHEYAGLLYYHILSK